MKRKINTIRASTQSSHHSFASMNARRKRQTAIALLNTTFLKKKSRGFKSGDRVVNRHDLFIDEDTVDSKFLELVN
jgi:hypothetical protein